MLESSRPLVVVPIQTDIAANTYYYPDSNGRILTASAQVALFLRTAGGVTTTIEWSGATDETHPPAAGDWQDVTLLFRALIGTYGASYLNTTALLVGILPRGRWRIKYVTSDGTNSTEFMFSELDGKQIVIMLDPIVTGYLAIIAAATHLEDTQMNDGDRGMFALAVRNDQAAANFTTNNGDYSGIAVTQQGALFAVPDPHVAPQMYGDAYKGVSGLESPFFPIGPGYDIQVVTSCTVAQGSKTFYVNTQQCATVVISAQSLDWTGTSVTFLAVNPAGPNTYLKGFVLNGTNPIRSCVSQITSDNMIVVPCAGVNLLAVSISGVTNATLNISVEGSLQEYPVGELAGKYLEDTASADGDFGNAIVTVRQDAPSSTTNTNGDYALAKSNVNGSMWSALDPGADRNVTGSCTTGEVAKVIEINTQGCSTVLLFALCANWNTAYIVFWGLLPDGSTQSNVGAYRIGLTDPVRSVVNSINASDKYIIPCAGFSKIYASILAVAAPGATVFVSMDATICTYPVAELAGKYMQDTAAAATDYGMGLVARRQDTLLGLTGADGDYGLIKADRNGAVYVTMSSAAGLGPVFAEDTAHNTGDAGMNILARRNDVASNSAGTDGDYCEFNIDANGYLRAVLESYDAASNADRTLCVNPLPGFRTAGDAPVALISASQDFSTSWVQLGVEVPTMGYTRITLWMDLHSGDSDSNDMEVRMMGRHTSGGSDYLMPLFNPVCTATPFYVQFEGEYFELNYDGAAVETKIQITWDVSNTIPYVTFWIKCKVTGVTKSHIASAYVTYGWAS